MSDAPLLLAVVAGMVATVNPCGFALLPTYLSLLLTDDRDGSVPAAVGHALWLSAAMTAGFVAVFGAAGLVLAPAAGWLNTRLPWLTVALGVTIVTFGVWLLAGRSLPFPRLGPARAPRLTGSAWSMALFGAVYALASLSCTIGPFVAIVVASARAGSAADGVALYLAYAAGMGLVVATAAVAVSLARTSLVTRLRRTGAAVPYAAAALLVLTGGYVAYYGWYELRVAADPSAAAADPLAGPGSVPQQVRHWLADGLDRMGVSAVAGVLLLLLAVAVLAATLRQGRQPGGNSPAQLPAQHVRSAGDQPAGAPQGPPEPGPSQRAQGARRRRRRRTAVGAGGDR